MFLCVELGVLCVKKYISVRLLEERMYDSVAQVASRVGYDDARSFSRAFRQRFGKLPSEVMEA